MAELERFIHQIKTRPDLHYWLLDQQWQQVDYEVVLALRPDQVQAGVACYPNGEVLCAFGTIRRLPEGVTFLIEPRKNSNTMRFDRKLVRNGQGGVEIRHSRSASRAGDTRNHYATTLTNRRPHKVRVIKFAPFDRGLLGVKKDPMKGYYSADQFCSWYGVNDPQGWIASGQSVCDPDNYASGRGVWAFFFEDEAGTCFIATAPLTND